MLLFTCARDSNYADIKKYGLRQSGLGHRLLRSLEATQEQCNGRILVIDLGRKELQECKVKDEVVIAPAVRLQSFRNLNPFMPTHPVTAAGGVIVRRRDGKLDVLMIYRRGAWDLPKGKLDPGESVAECARREVSEELGVTEVDIVAPLQATLHGYREGDRYIVKTTHWYLMRTESNRFTPQAEEDIEKVKWMNWKEAREKAGFDTLRELLKGARSTAEKNA